MSDELKQCRDQIDAIDEQLLKLVNQRAQLAREIGNLKGGGPTYRPEREAQVLRRLLEHNEGPLSDEAITAIFRSVMSNCRALEKELSVAFLGPMGTFSEEAANKQFGGLTSPVQCASIDDVFRMVESGQVDYGVVPVENSTEGAVGRTLDLLMATSLHICGEIALPVHHNLLSKQTDKSGIRKLYSHAQSLAQCHEWLNLNLPGIERQAVVSNASSVSDTALYVAVLIVCSDSSTALCAPAAAAVNARQAGVSTFSRICAASASPSAANAICRASISTLSRRARRRSFTARSSSWSGLPSSSYRTGASSDSIFSVSPRSISSLRFAVSR